LSAGLARWRAPRAVHDLAKVLTDLAIAVALGGDCAADVAVVQITMLAADLLVWTQVLALARQSPRRWETKLCACDYWPSPGASSAPDDAVSYVRPAAGYRANSSKPAGQHCNPANDSHHPNHQGPRSTGETQRRNPTPPHDTSTPQHTTGHQLQVTRRVGDWRGGGS
jgi:hypothetical protein